MATPDRPVEPAARRRDLHTISLVGLAHGTSHFFHMLLPPLFPVFSQAFDGVTAPALPAGWTASLAAGPSPTWVTSLASPDSAPNAAFVDNPALVSDRVFDSPSNAIPAGGGILEFRSNYSTETGYDGSRGSSSSWVRSRITPSARPRTYTSHWLRRSTTARRRSSIRRT